MWTPEMQRDFDKARANFTKKRPTKADLLRLGKDYAEAWFKHDRVHADVDKVRGLDEWDPKHVAWENRLWKADCKRELAMEILKMAFRAHHYKGKKLEDAMP
jgi:hypothetical protein